MLIPAVLLKSLLEIWRATPNVISSPESADGASPSDVLDGPKTDPSGQPPSLASHLARQENNSAPTTSATSPRVSLNLFGSATLQQSLENKLRANLHGMTGSPEYVWNLKHWDMKSGLPIFAVRARARSEKDGLCVAIRSLGSESSSEHPTSDSGFTGSLVGWPTPIEDDANNVTRDSGSFQSLVRAAQMTGWGTPRVSDGTLAETTTMPPSGPRSRLELEVLLTGSASPLPPTASEVMTKSSETNVPSADSPTPRTANALDQPMTATNMKSSTESFTLVGWATPGARDHKDTPGMSATGVNPDGSIRNRLDQLGRQVGLTNCSPAETARPAALNPAFSRWLMGYPVEWCRAAIRVTRATPTPRRKPAQSV